MRYSEGTRFGPYLILSSFEENGMADAYRARDQRTDRDVVLKVLSGDRPLDLITRFELDAQALRRINHPNVSRLLTSGIECGQCYWAWEAGQGESLRSLIAKGGSSPDLVLSIAVQVASGLAAAHSVGVLHCHLKPENVIVGQQGRVVILDFPLGVTDQHSVNGAGQQTETIEQTLLMNHHETADYLSPEQARGRPCEAQSDQFSLGSILFELLTGSPPFHRNGIVQTIFAIINDAPPSLPENCPSALRTIMTRCLAKNPASRFGSTSDLVNELKSAQSTVSDPMLGRVVGRYKILNCLGTGGMGIVYRAEDTRLKRYVALKFLSTRTLSEPEVKARFIAEAQSAAGLDHPAICTIYEIDEVEGEIFIAMACIEGETLRARIRRQPLEIEEARRIAIQVAQGLGEAHRKGIVHRDIKSANIMINLQGQAKIMDFGVAQPAGQSKASGITVGTAAYMSPEQARGEVVDPRADIWSLGVVFFEMLTGQLPLRAGSGLGLLYAIFNDPPLTLEAVRPGLSRDAQHIISRAMAKRREDRYSSANELLADLHMLGGASDSTHPRSEVTMRATRTSKPAVAVLPFVDLTPDHDHEYFCEGMAEEVINALAQLDTLMVVSRAASAQLGNPLLTPKEIGDKLNVSSVLEGSVRRSGKRLRVAARLISVADGFQIWAQRFDREMEDVFDIQDEIAKAIVDALKVRLSPAQSMPMVRRYTENLEAYHLYLKGRHHWNRRASGSIGRASEFFQQALAADPNYAPALAGMADCCLVPAYFSIAPMLVMGPRARAFAMRAREIDPSVAEAEASLATVAALHDYDWQNADELFRHAIALNPTYATAFNWYALFGLSPTGRLDDGLTQAKHACNVDPLSPAPACTVGIMHFLKRNYDEAIVELEKTLDLDPNFGLAHFYMGQCFMYKGMGDESKNHLKLSRGLIPLSAGIIGFQSKVAAHFGDRDEAQSFVTQIETMATKQYVSPGALAIAFLGLKNFDRAFEFLFEAQRDRSSMLLWLKCEPTFDEVRADPRFKTLLAGMNFA